MKGCSQRSNLLLFGILCYLLARLKYKAYSITVLHIIHRALFLTLYCRALQICKVKVPRLGSKIATNWYRVS